MPLVLVAGATIECMHAGAPFGKAAISGGDGRLAVSGNGALTAGMEVGISFEAGKPGVLKACTYQNPSGAKQACTATFAAITGISAMLSVGGLPVLLDTAAGPALNLIDSGASWKVADAGQQLLSVSG
jgi:hypothetical protein